MQNDLTPIYLRMHEPIRRFVLSKVPDPQQADDLVQDVFLRVHDQKDRLTHKDKLDAWIYQITRNRIIDFYRTRKTPEQLDGAARDFQHTGV